MTLASIVPVVGMGTGFNILIVDMMLHEKWEVVLTYFKSMDMEINIYRSCGVEECRHPHKRSYNIFTRLAMNTAVNKVELLHARPWIPGIEKSIFTIVIHQWRSPLRLCKNNRRMWCHNASTRRSCDVTDQLWWRRNAKSENTVLSDNGEISDRLLWEIK